MTTGRVQRTYDNGALVNAVMFAIGGAAVIYYIYLGSPQSLPEETCLGSHTSAMTIKAGDTRLISIPRQGFDFYDIELSPECRSLEPTKDAILVLGQPSLCVGDDLSGLGGVDSACRVTSIRRIRETQAKSEM